MTQLSTTTTTESLSWPSPPVLDSSLAGDRPRLGLLFVWATPVLAGVACLQGIDIGGVAYTGFLWMGLMVAGLLILLAEKAVHRTAWIRFPLAPWLLWLSYVWLSLLWCSPLSGRNIQDAMQISMPVLVGVLASVFIRTPEQVQQLLRGFWLTLLSLTLAVACWKVGLIGGGEEGSTGVGIAPRVMALTLCVVGSALVAAWPERLLAPAFGWGMCLFLTFITGSRMATAALLLVPILHPLLRSRTLRGLMILGTLGLGVVLFHTRVFQERFFHEGSGSLSDLFQGQFLGFGRFEVWPTLWEEAWRRPWLGMGVGSCFSYIPTVWDRMTHPHNDFLRVGLELGLIGVVLFVTVTLFQGLHIKRLLRTETGPVRRAAAAGLLGLMLFLITACTDNPLVYNLWFMNPLFALLGAAYGAAGQTDGEERIHDATE